MSEVQAGARPRLSDPALEPGEDGKTLLQRRLSLYGKVLVLQSIPYWLIYALIWDPTVGFARRSATSSRRMSSC